MSALVTRLAPPEGFRSREAGRVIAMLDLLTRHLSALVADLSPEDLAWQPAPGTNTIGMLLAHVAHAEAHLGQVGLKGEPEGHAHDVIGIHERDLGMPLGADGAPPAALSGRDAASFLAMLAAARAHTREAAAALADEDLARLIERPPRPDGTRRAFDVAWVLFHLVEHAAGHAGQIALLRLLRRAG
jgi:uncharacterized damage-inducible protein DinB